MSRLLLVKKFAVHNSLLSALVQNTSLKENVLVGNVTLMEDLMGYWWKIIFLLKYSGLT